MNGTFLANILSVFGVHGAKSPHEVERHGRIGMMGHARCFAQRVRCVVLRNVPGITVLMVLGHRVSQNMNVLRPSVVCGRALFDN